MFPTHIGTEVDEDIGVSCALGDELEPLVGLFETNPSLRPNPTPNPCPNPNPNPHPMTLGGAGRWF